MVVLTLPLKAATGGASEHPDAVGNLETDGTGTYTYTPFNLMATATVNGVKTTYGYDGDNQRKRKEGPDGVRYYVHGPGGQLLAEYRETVAGPELVREYIYLGSKLLASSSRVDPPVPTGRVTGLASAPQAQKYGLPVTVTVTGWTRHAGRVSIQRPEMAVGGLRAEAAAVHVQRQRKARSNGADGCR